MFMDERPVHKETHTGHTLCGYVSFNLRYEREAGCVTCRKCLRRMMLQTPKKELL